MGSTKEPTGFMHLPPEIRTIVYKKYLINPLSVGISDRREYVEDDGYSINPQSKTRLAGWFPQWSRRKSILSLFLTNKTIGEEATSIFYKENSFGIMLCRRDPGWRWLYRWLMEIGPRNRSFLTKITVYYDYLKYEEWDENWRKSEIVKSDLSYYPATDYLVVTRSPKVRRVETIDPKIEKVFELLKGRAEDSKLTIKMKLPHEFNCPRYPVYRFPSDNDDGDDEESDISTEPDSDDPDTSDEEESDEDDSDEEDELALSSETSLPDSLEEYAKLVGEGNEVSVHWKGYVKLDRLEERKISLKAHGWEILKTKNHNHHSRPDMALTLRKKVLGA